MTSTKAAALLAAVIAVGGHAGYAARQSAVEHQPAMASFDCAKATAAGETLVCGDAQLARLDVELARLYQLAREAPQLEAGQRNELEASQRVWIRGRDDCWKADDRRQCVADTYVLRIHELRQNYVGTKTADPAGISTGPFISRCQGLNELVSTHFVNVEPPMVSLLWLDTYALVLTAGPGASGRRYARKYEDGEYVYWEKGDEALFQAPGRRDAVCRITESN
ncbi:MAG TPA: MliC family protein [Vicinamibacterales bacterium]|nr:MliC family protein [Vicinamibacterales bacterium]